MAPAHLQAVVRGFLARHAVQPVLRAHRAARLRLAEATALAVVGAWGPTFRARLAFLRLRWEGLCPAAVTLRPRACTTSARPAAKDGGFCIAPRWKFGVVMSVLHSLTGAASNAGACCRMARWSTNMDSRL